MKRRVLSPAQLARVVARFNAAHPIGTEGFLEKDNGERVVTKVADVAYVLSGHTAVASFEGVRGCYSIKRFHLDQRKEERRTPRRREVDALPLNQTCGETA